MTSSPIARGTRINKPKVFLSHAWENKPFIQRLAAICVAANDLQIDESLDHTVTLNPEEPQISERETDEARFTAEVRAADKTIRQARIRKAWSTNGEGTKAVVSDIQWLFENLKDRVSKSNKVSELFQLDYQADTNRCSITTGDVTLLVEGNCPSQKTDDCLVKVSVEARKLELSEPLALPVQIFLNTFVVKVDKSLQLKWVKVGEGDAWTTPKLGRSLLE